MKNKLTVSILLAVSLLALPAFSQTNTPPAMSTNDVTTVPQFFSDIWNLTFAPGLTNLSVAVLGTYTPSVKEWGGEVAVIRNIPIGGAVGAGLGMGLDYYGGDLYGLNIQTSVKATMTPLSSFGTWGKSILVTPFGAVALGTPFSGSNDNGDLETIAMTGAAVRLAKVFGADFELLGVYGTRAGVGDISGVFYGGGLDLTWRF